MRFTDISFMPMTAQKWTPAENMGGICQDWSGQNLERLYIVTNQPLPWVCTARKLKTVADWLHYTAAPDSVCSGFDKFPPLFFAYQAKKWVSEHDYVPVFLQFLNLRPRSYVLLLNFILHLFSCNLLYWSGIISFCYSLAHCCL